MNASPSGWTDRPVYTLPFPEVCFDVASTDDVVARAYDFGGTGHPFVVGHATGLHSHAYAPLIERLRHHFHCYAIDVRAQGQATSPANGNFSWDGITEDFCRGLDALELSGRGDVFGVGHSQGGYSLISGERHRPGTFGGIFGYEPVIFPRTFDSGPNDNGMAVAARRRRDVFASKQSAYENFKAKPPLSEIDDECLRAYVEYGFNASLDPETGEPCVRLACRPEDEASLFECANTDLIDHLDEIKTRVIIGCGEFTGDHFKEITPLQAQNLSNGTLQAFPGRSHFGLLERTEEMAATIVEMFL